MPLISKRICSSRETHQKLSKADLQIGSLVNNSLAPKPAAQPHCIGSNWLWLFISPDQDNWVKEMKYNYLRKINLIIHSICVISIYKYIIKLYKFFKNIKYILRSTQRKSISDNLTKKILKKGKKNVIPINCLQITV